MTFVVVLVLIIVGGTAYCFYNTINARQGVDLTVDGSRREVLARVDAYFGRTWTRDSGPGDVNVYPTLRVKPATLSISVVEVHPRRCQVSIWTSSWNSHYGLMGHAQLARRKKNGLAAALSRPAPIDPGRRPVAS